MNTKLVIVLFHCLGLEVKAQMDLKKAPSPTDR